MKYLIIYLFTMVNVLAGFPPTTVKSQNDTVKQTTFNLEAPNYQATSLNGTTKLIETGNNNVLKDPGFEGNSLQWVTYADAAGTAPVDGTGGTANVTIAYTTTSPLNGKKSMLFTKDAANRQGQGTSLDFTIPDINKGKVNNIKISYDIVSGTYATGDLAMWVINVDPASATNGRVIQPSAYTIENSGLKESKFLEFQSDIDSNLYRLVIHVTSTSTNAYSLRFDDVSVGLGNKIYGSVVTDWMNYTPTGSWSANTTYSGRWRRVGDSAELQINVELSGAPNAVDLNFTSSQLLNGLGISVNTLKLAGNGGTQDLTSLGVGSYSDQGTANRGGLTVAWEKSSSLVKVTGASFSDPNATAPITWANGDNLSIIMIIPIQGWSTTQQLSSDADTRVITAKLYRSGSNQTVASGSEVKAGLNTALFDDVGGFDPVNNRYVVKVAGRYRVSASVMHGANPTGVRTCVIYKNGSEATRTQIVPPSANNSSATANDIIDLKVGDYLEVYANQTSGGNLDISQGVAYTFMSIERISGPSQIAASESVTAAYYVSANFSTSTTTPINYDTKELDSHNAVTVSPTAWRFTAPMSGVYDISNLLYITSSACNFYIYKNGSSAKYIGYTDSATGLRTINTTAVRLLAGEYIDIRPDASVTVRGGALTTNVTGYISIKRTGNY